MKTKKKFGAPYLDSEPKQPRSNLIYKSKFKLAVIPEEVEAITQQKIKELAKDAPKSTPRRRYLLEDKSSLFTMITTKFVKYKHQKRSYYYSAWQRGQLAQSIQYPSPEMEDPSPDMEDPSPDINYPSPDELLPIVYNSANFGFTDSEIISLRLALKFCVIKSVEVVKSSLIAFEDHIDEFELWFGSVQDPTLKNYARNRVVNGVMKMHQVLCNSKQIITFVDMRHQRASSGMPSSIHTPAPGLATCYGKSSTEFVSGKYPSYPPTTEGLEVPKHLPSQGLRILVGEHIMQPFQTIQTRAAIIYHEMTHKILNTMDNGFIRHTDAKHGILHIFGQDKAKQMAKDFPGKTLLIADCWANFVIYFGEKTKIN